jgi:hypothetical protein
MEHWSQERIYGSIDDALVSPSGVGLNTERRHPQRNPERPPDQPTTVPARWRRSDPAARRGKIGHVGDEGIPEEREKLDMIAVLRDRSCFPFSVWWGGISVGQSTNGLTKIHETQTKCNKTLTGRAKTNQRPAQPWELRALPRYTRGWVLCHM